MYICICGRWLFSFGFNLFVVMGREEWGGSKDFSKILTPINTVFRSFLLGAIKYLARGWPDLP